MKNLIILLSLFCIACENNNSTENIDFQLEVGDILFQDLDSSPLCDAIELVTPGFKDGNFSHIGIVVEIGNPYYMNPEQTEHIRILEALPGGVITTRLDSFLMRSADYNNNPKVIVGRLDDEYKHTIPTAVQFAKKQIGVEYDEIFILNNDKYYCSELIYEAFSQDSVFHLEPMTFLHPESNDTLPTWEDYYTEIGVEIPQNKMGINPGSMSLSEKIKIIHFYGIPDGMKK